MSMSTSSATYGSATYGSGTTGMATSNTGMTSSNTGMSSNTGLNPCCNDPGHRESVACKTKGSRACYALVTGASDGIGNKVACGLLKNNIHVFLTARDEANAMATKRELEMCEETRGEAKCCLSALELDVLKDESITHCADRLKASGIKLDKLICNAGVATRSTNVTLKSARDCINVNFYGYWKTFEYLRSRGLLENGCSVIFVSSNMGIMSLEQSSKELLHRLFEPSLTVEGLSQIAEEFVHSVEQGEDAVRRHGFAIFEHTETQWDYAFSKALIIILTKILAKKYEGQYFINTVHPGYVQTAMTHHTKEADYTPQQGAEPIVQLAVATHKQTGCYYDRSECKYNLLFCSTSDIFLEKVKEQKSTMEKFKDKAKETWDKMKHPTTSSSSTTATAGGTTTTTTTTRH